MRAPVVRRLWVGLLAAVLATSACAGGPATSATGSSRPGSALPTTASTAPALVVGGSAWVSVSVATLWRSPDSPRRVDAPALARPARIRQWLADLTLQQRRELNGRADTQALLGDRVVVLALPSSRPAWARIAVPSQPSPLGSRGYPGWVPRRQLTAVVPPSTSTVATVVTRIAWLRTDTSDARRVFPVSLGTRLPVVGSTTGSVRVRAPGGVVRRLTSKAVVVHAAGTAALAPSRSSLVTTAEVFRGLPYLWAGASGFGLDCSGLTWLTYRVHGIRIPRDAAPQSRHGAVANPWRRGDLLFYATSGVVHHVSMFVGNGQMIHSPATGRVVSVVTVLRPNAGARDYMP